MVRGRNWRWALTGAAVGLVLACGAKPPVTGADASYGVRITEVVGDGSLTDAQSLLNTSLADATWLRAVDQGQVDLDASLGYAVIVGNAGQESLRFELRVDPPDDLRGVLGRELEATVEVARARDPIDVRRDLPMAADRAVAVLDAKMTLALGGDRGITRLLADDDPELVSLALDWVSRHRLRQFADQVVPLLRAPQDHVVLRSVECLGAIGGQEHVVALLAAARLSDRAHANRLYEALAGLGGDQARGFLEFAVRNEDDPMLANVARRALERIDAAPLVSTPPGPPPPRGHR